jgi:hypothetical protein
MPGVLHRALSIGIEGDFHLDHAIDGPVGAPRFHKALSYIGKQHLGIELRRLAAGTNVTLGNLAGHFCHGRTGRGQIDWNRPVWAVIEGGLLGLIILAFKCYALLGPQAAHQRDRFQQACGALFKSRPLEAGRRHVVERFAAAHAKDDAAREHARQCRKRLRHDRRMISKRCGHHACAHDDALCPSTQGSEPRYGCRSMPTSVLPGLKVIADEDRIEPDLLCGAGEVQEIGRAELFGGGLIPLPELIESEIMGIFC